MIFHQSRILCS